MHKKFKSITPLISKMNIHHTKHSVLQEVIQVLGSDGMSKLIENCCTFPGHYAAENQTMKVS